jgi:hypothetical protein
MHALLIGIDDYPEVQKLRGAVADTSRMKRFLVETLGVPDDSTHIRMLTNEEATYENIISKISSLAQDAGIGHGDPILIYFAGHGSTLPKPSKWTSSGPEIQCLVAYDAGREAGKGFVKGVVPDIVFASLLKLIADAKGDNIVSHPSTLRSTSFHLRGKDCHSRLLSFRFWNA